MKFKNVLFYLEIQFSSTLQFKEILILLKKNYQRRPSVMNIL